MSKLCSTLSAEFLLGSPEPQQQKTCMLRIEIIECLVEIQKLDFSLSYDLLLKYFSNFDSWLSFGIFIIAYNSLKKKFVVYCSLLGFSV